MGLIMNTRFIAEVSSNHHQNLDRCLAFVDKAAEIGCAGVKFQLFRVRELFAPEILARSPKHRAREAWELPVSFVAPIAGRCRELGIEFLCTPFYLGAVAELVPHIDAFKIASYELLWDDLLVACAGTGKPVVLSTGMATLDEVCRAVGVLRKAGCQELTLLHVVSAYPTPPSEANLAAIETLREACDCPVGWSDHTVCPAVISRAVHRFGAAMIEFHMDLDGNGEEYGAGHCWLPHTIEPVISSIRTGLEADGSGDKAPGPSELPDRDWRSDPVDGLRPLLRVRRRFEG